MFPQLSLAEFFGASNGLSRPIPLFGSYCSATYYVGQLDASFETASDNVGIALTMGLRLPQQLVDFVGDSDSLGQ